MFPSWLLYTDPWALLVWEQLKMSFTMYGTLNGLMLLFIFASSFEIAREL